MISHTEKLDNRRFRHRHKLSLILSSDNQVLISVTELGLVDNSFKDSKMDETQVYVKMKLSIFDYPCEMNFYGQDFFLFCKSCVSLLVFTTAYELNSFYIIVCFIFINILQANERFDLCSKLT